THLKGMGSDEVSVAFAHMAPGPYHGEFKVSYAGAPNNTFQIVHLQGNGLALFTLSTPSINFGEHLVVGQLYIESFTITNHTTKALACTLVPPKDTVFTTIPAGAVNVPPMGDAKVVVTFKTIKAC